MRKEELYVLLFIAVMMIGSVALVHLNIYLGYPVIGVGL